MKRQKYLGIILAILLIIVSCTAVAFAEPEDPQEGAEPEQPAEPEPTIEPEVTPTPTPAATATPTPTPTPTSAPTPTATPTPTPVPTPTPIISAAPEQAGSELVNVTFYVYANGSAASGYTVQLGNATQTTNSDGMVSYPDVEVDAQRVLITKPSGEQSTGRILLSRGSSTDILEVSAGGEYSISVAMGTHNLYATVVFTPDQAIEITSVGQTRTPAPPVANPSASQVAQGSFTITADFVDQQGNPVQGLSVTVVQDLNPVAEGVLDNGRFVVRQGGFGDFLWNLQPANTIEPLTQITTHITQGTATGIASQSGNEYTVQTTGMSGDLYLVFEQTAGGYRLIEASDSVPAGINTMLLGIIIVAVIVVIIIIVANVLRRKKKKDNTIPPGNNDLRGRELEFEVDHTTDEEIKIYDRPRQTGGENKFDDRSHM